MYLKRGDSSIQVKWLQQGLRITLYYQMSIDSTFGAGNETAVKKLQSDLGLDQTGIVDDATWAGLCSEILPIQQALKNKGFYSGSLDGVAGDGTYNAVLSFQTANGLSADGMVGPATRNKLYSTSGSTSSTITAADLPFQRGDKGSKIMLLQYSLMILACNPNGTDGVFGPGCETAVKRLQTRYGLSSTGIVDTTTWAKMSSLILEIQQALEAHGYDVGGADGVGGPTTYNQLRYFQADNGLTVDGMCGPATQQALLGTVSGGNDDLPLSRGDRGPRVTNLQWGLLIQGISPNGTDGVFGPGCESAVKRFQVKYNLSQTGIVDVATWDKLVAVVKNMQSLLANKGYTVGPIDGLGTETIFNAIKAFQADNGLTVDGMCGAGTMAVLNGGSSGTGTVSAVQKRGSNGSLTKYLQHILKQLGYNITIDGIFGADMENIVKSFQTAYGLEVDGMCGPGTWSKLFELYHVPVTAPAGTLEKFVAVARYELSLGFAEDNANNINPYGQWYGMNAQSWCAMFVSWCAYQAGISTTFIPKYAYCPTGANWYKQKGRYHNRADGNYTPKVGDIVFFYRAEVGRIGHTGIVVESANGEIVTIEGNTGDKVDTHRYNLTDLYIEGYGDNSPNSEAESENESKVQIIRYANSVFTKLGLGKYLSIFEFDFDKTFTLIDEPNVKVEAVVHHQLTTGTDLPGNISISVDGGVFAATGIETQLSNLVVFAESQYPSFPEISLAGVGTVLADGDIIIRYGTIGDSIQISIETVIADPSIYGLNGTLSLEVIYTIRLDNLPFSPELIADIKRLGNWQEDLDENELAYLTAALLVIIVALSLYFFGAAALWVISEILAYAVKYQIA